MKDKNKIKELEIKDALEYTKKIINVVHDPLVILYENLRVAVANRSFYKAFKVRPGETEGQYIYDLGNRQWNIPKLQELLEEVLPSTKSFDHFKVEHNFRDIGKRTMLLNGSRIFLQSNKTRLIVLNIKDITERRKTEERSEKMRDLEAMSSFHKV